MRRALAILLASVLLLVAVTPVAANSDPHRFFFDQAPFTLDRTYCAFPVRGEFLVVRSYATETDLADGTVVLTIRGSAFVKATNLHTGKSITLNASGPGTFRFSPDGAFAADFFGRGALFAPNLVDFGFPSNFVALAGPLHLTAMPPDPGVTSVSGHATVVTDVCAALG